jgi:hypothetical protein
MNARQLAHDNADIANELIDDDLHIDNVDVANTRALLAIAYAVLALSGPAETDAGE